MLQGGLWACPPGNFKFRPFEIISGAVSGQNTTYIAIRHRHNSWGGDLSINMQPPQPPCFLRQCNRFIAMVTVEFFIKDMHLKKWRYRDGNKAHAETMQFI